MLSSSARLSHTVAKSLRLNRRKEETLVEARLLTQIWRRAGVIRCKEVALTSLWAERRLDWKWFCRAKKGPGVKILESRASKGGCRMRAAWYEKQGPARDVLMVGEMPDPHPTVGEV
jgi:hypothetical protein